MTLTDPRRLAVLKNLQATLQSMVGPAYHYAVDDASQVTLDPTVNPLTGAIDGKLWMIEPSSNSDRQFWPSEQLTEDFEVNITSRVDIDASDALAKATAWEFMAADLETVLTADPERGGLACDTRLMPPQPFVGVGSNIVIAVHPVRIKLYRAYKDGT